jgi:uncharacterized protein with gpF-like domain
MVGNTYRSKMFDARREKKNTKAVKFRANAEAERNFYRALKKVAKTSSHIIEHHRDGLSIKDDRAMMKALKSYAELLGPWAERQSAKLLEKVEKSNKRAFRQQSKTMATLLNTGPANANVVEVARKLMNEQVALIKSLPIEAGLRAQKIAFDNILNGRRAIPDPSVVKQLMEDMEMTESVAINRAKLIARTETARANASFVQARASAVGVTHYIWRATMDGIPPMRAAHGKMNGKIVAYSKPPTLVDGTTGHAGTFPNCRCWQEPILPDLD